MRVTVDFVAFMIQSESSQSPVAEARRDAISGAEGLPSGGAFFSCLGSTRLRLDRVTFSEGAYYL